MSYSLDTSDQTIIHIINKNQKYTIVEKKNTKLIKRLRHVKNIYYQDNLFIHSDLTNRSDPFVIITNENILVKIDNTLYFKNNNFVRQSSARESLNKSYILSNEGDSP